MQSRNAKSLSSCLWDEYISLSQLSINYPGSEAWVEISPFCFFLVQSRIAIRALKGMRKSLLTISLKLKGGSNPVRRITKRE